MKKKQLITTIVLSFVACITSAQPISHCTTPTVQAQKKSSTPKKKISRKKLTLKVGQKKTLSLQSTTKKEKKKIIWKSSNKKIATVSKKGVVKAKKKGFSVSWKIRKKTIKKMGYEIQYSENKKFTSKRKTLRQYNTKYRTVLHLRKNQKYYVRIREYRYINGKKKCGKWSRTHSVKTK